MRFALLAVAAAGLSLTAQSVPERSAITVSAAVSLTDALSAIAKDYVNAGRGNVRFNFAASNTLARQIVGGAPVDLFISADEAQMDVVAKEGLLKDGSRIDLLSNQLAVVVPNDRPRTFTSLKELAGPAFKRIALGDPAAVPAGVYAKQLLEKEGLWAAIQPRVVPTASVRAALAAVESGAADAAIVYRTDARLALRATVAWVVSSEGGPRIVYPAAIIRTSTLQAEAARFLEFLRSADARRTFERFGFTALPMAERRGPEPPGSERAAASEPTRAERGAGVPASARLRQGYGEVSPERSARRRKRVGGSGGAKPPG